MKKTTKSLLISATVLLSLAPAATLAAGATTNTADAEAVYYNKAGHFAGPSINISYNNAIQVKTGTSQFSLSKVNASDVTATSVSDKENLGVTATGDTNLYTSLNAAVLQDQKSLANDSTAKDGSVAYQRVYVKVNGLDTNNALLSMQIPYSPARITFNGAEMNYTNYANGNGSFVVYRTVTTSDNPSTSNGFNFYDINTKGVVKVTKQGSPAQLYDANGNVISTRALGPATDWFTDTQRIAQNGKVFYRVSTSEYVAESDVDFYPAANGTSATSALAN